MFQFTQRHPGTMQLEHRVREPEISQRTSLVILMEPGNPQKHRYGGGWNKIRVLLPQH